MAAALAAVLLSPAAVSGAALAAPDPLDDLYAHLAAAGTRAQAATIEREIVQQSGRAISPTAAILLDAAHSEQANDQPDKAIADIGAALDLQPDLGPLWRERGIARLHAGDASGAVADLGHAIDIDRRDFLAWATLSLALEQRGNTAGALAAWRKVLAIDPHAEGAQTRLETLKRRDEGEHA